mgnify:CR=1 FL=1
MLWEACRKGFAGEPLTELEALMLVGYTMQLEQLLTEYNTYPELDATLKTGYASRALLN